MYIVIIIVLFITFTFARMTKILLYIYEIHDIFWARHIESRDFSRIGRITHAVVCLHHLLPYVGTIGSNGITNGTSGKTLNGIMSTNGTIFSSPEPSGSQGELIVYPCSVVRPSVRRPSVVRRPPLSKIFFSETAWPTKAKFYMKHLWEGGTNVYINNPGHMTKMAAMPIYGKNPSKIFFSGTGGLISTKLGMKH